MGVETVMELNVVRRQSGSYRDALMRLRDAKTTREDWMDFWNENCGVEGMGARHEEFVNDPNIGDREPTPGYLYVVLSRPTLIENLCLGKAKPYDRWSTKLQTKAMELRLLEDYKLRTLVTKTKSFFGIQ